MAHFQKIVEQIDDGAKISVTSGFLVVLGNLSVFAKLLWPLINTVTTSAAVPISSQYWLAARTHTHTYVHIHVYVRLCV